MSDPTIRYPRSAFNQNFPKSTSWRHGELIPLDCVVVEPGTTLKLDLGALIRMNTPIAPFSGEIECEINVFYTPWRILWEHTEEFFGANKTGAGAPSTTYTMPKGNLFSGIVWDSVGAYLGKPLTSYDASKTCYHCILKERGYFQIWSDFYRASMLQAPFIINKGDTGAIGTIDGTTVNSGATGNLRKVCKTRDYFTNALQSPQYGSNAVTLPLGSIAPVGIYNSNGLGITSAADNWISEELRNVEAITPSDKFAQMYAVEYQGTPTFNLVADLSQATAATINSIRYAFATQRFLELSNYGGSYYWSQLQAHYGVTPADASLQRPERLGTWNFTLNVSQVTATANTTVGGAVSPAGSVGAISVTGSSRSVFTKAFTEFGYVYVLLHTRVRHQLYSQGLNREDFSFNRLDWFTPEFSHIGDQPLYKKEIMVTGDASDDEVFGYQEAWSHEKYRFGSATGVTNPNAGAGVAVNIWNLSNQFASRPSLDDTFILEDRDVVASRLLTGTSSKYDYVGLFNFHYEKITEVPIHSLPGLMDHVGNR